MRFFTGDDRQSVVFFSRGAHRAAFALAGRVRAGVGAAFTIGANLGSLGVRRLLDRLFTLLNLCGKGSLHGLRSYFGALLDDVSCGRARWCGQVGQL